MREALCQILDPVISPSLDELTIDDRSANEHAKGLATALKLSADTKRLVWITVSVRRLSEGVSLDRLLDLFWDYLPNRKLIFLVEDLLRTPGNNGIPPGSRLAALLMHLFLDRAVVRKWRELHPKVPLIRCGGAFLVLCTDRKAAEGLHSALTKLLHEAGLPLHQEEKETPIRDLNAGEKATLPGCTIGRRDGEWQIEPDKSTRRRKKRLHAAASLGSPLAL